MQLLYERLRSDYMVFGAPQIIIIVLGVLSIGMSIESHGKEKKGKESFFTTIIGASIQMFILYWGGFFS